MKRILTLTILAALVISAPGLADAQFSVSFGRGCANPFGLSQYNRFGPFTSYPLASGGLHYGVHSAPHYGSHFGTHVGPYNTFGFRNYGLHSGGHFDSHSGTHNDLHDVTGHVGEPYGGLYGYGGYGAPVYGYGSSPLLFPGYSTGFSLSYGTPYRGLSYGYSYGAALPSYGNGIGGPPSSGAYEASRGRGTSGYLPELSYDRTRPKTSASSDEQPGEGKKKASVDEQPAGTIHRGDVQIDFLNAGKSIEVAWMGNADDVKTATFTMKDSSRLPLVLRKVSVAPFKTRFVLTPSVRSVSVDVEFKDGVTSATQIPLQQ